MTTPTNLPDEQRIAVRSDEYDARYGDDDLAEAMARALKETK